MKTLPYFLDTLERCWSWCETKNVPIESLDIVCDGGGGYGAEARTTRMSLHMGFGVTFERARTCVPHAKPGLRSVRVPLPPAHPLRAHHPTTRGSLDLGKLLWLTSRA
jgi:hypothetical protein